MYKLDNLRLRLNIHIHYKLMYHLIHLETSNVIVIASAVLLHHKHAPHSKHL
jgi:hypothetical protein